ncbi:hypothetical protein CFP56_022816 [Quercus suber]|uniref:Uncharacterized protein n=1 Tax=Quercus suber TaxID=58331 RepID=A0AAW0KCE2_QUESU
MSIVNVEEEVEKLNDAEERQVKEKAVNYRPQSRWTYENWKGTELSGPILKMT